jgi:hypothetical protein
VLEKSRDQFASRKKIRTRILDELRYLKNDFLWLV